MNPRLPGNATPANPARPPCLASAPPTGSGQNDALDSPTRHTPRAPRPGPPCPRALASRARRLAPKAQPAQGLTLSLCMIVKDEEEMLAKCLAAAAPAVDEIIVVDTGSTDRTIEIAKEFGAEVIEQPWTGSFSDARN